MSSRYAILRMEKLKRDHIQEIKRRCEHVNRRDFADNVRKDLSDRNVCLVGEEGSDWFQLFKDRYKELDYYKHKDSRKLRSDAVIGIEAVTTMSHDMAGDIDIEDWCKSNIEWMQEKFGTENVAHAVMHMDEGTPHIHFFITPVKDGRFNAKEVLGGREEYELMQTSYAEKMDKFGLKRGLHRGYRIPYVELKNLYAEAGKVQDAPEIFDGETVAEYRKRINEQYRSLQVALNFKQKDNDRLEITRDYAHELELQIEELKKEIQDLEAQEPTVAGMSVHDINVALENYPDKESIHQYRDLIANLEKWGREFSERQELDVAEHAHESAGE